MGVAVHAHVPQLSLAFILTQSPPQSPTVNPTPVTLTAGGRAVHVPQLCLGFEDRHVRVVGAPGPGIQDSTHGGVFDDRELHDTVRHGERDGIIIDIQTTPLSHIA